MDCQKLIVYGILLLVGIYVLRDVCGIKIPLIEGMNNANAAPVNSNSELLNTPPTPSLPSTVQSVENSQIGVDTRNTGGPSDVQQGQLAAAEPQGSVRGRGRAQLAGHCGRQGAGGVCLQGIPAVDARLLQEQRRRGYAGGPRPASAPRHALGAAVSDAVSRADRKRLRAVAL